MRASKTAGATLGFLPFNRPRNSGLDRILGELKSWSDLRFALSAAAPLMYIAGKDMPGLRQEFAEGNQTPPVSGEDLLPHVYDELRRLAAHQMAGESAPQTIQPTALVHEAWLRLASTKAPPWKDKQHFFASAALAMRRILVDRARAKQAAKRGGNPERTTMNGKEFGNVVAPDEDERLLALDKALAKFAVVHPEKAQLVQMRYFAGLTNGQASEIMGISEITAKRWWAYARAWLQREIASARSSSSV